MNHTAVAWFLVAVFRVCDDVVDNPDVAGIMELISGGDCAVTRAFATIMYPKVVAESAGAHLDDLSSQVNEACSLEDLEAMKPQHDNDFPFDYRMVGILPTADEINSKVSSASNIQSKWVSQIGSAEGTEGSLLDRHFRLLREDMVAPMKEEIDEYRRCQQVGGRNYGEHTQSVKTSRSMTSRLFAAPGIVGVLSGKTPCVSVRMKVPYSMGKRVKGMNAKDRSDFFETDGRRVLAKDSMLAFITDDDVTCIGLVVSRDKEVFVVSWQPLSQYSEHDRTPIQGVE